jgi:hypothetical protein
MNPSPLQALLDLLIGDGRVAPMPKSAAAISIAIVACPMSY